MSPLQPMPVPCPLCGEDDPSPLFRVGDPFMSIVRCRACRMMYQSPRIPESEMGDAHLHFEEYSHYPALNAAKFELFAHRVDQLTEKADLPQAGAFLDIGTGYGSMLDAIADRYPAWDRTAVEISLSAREELARRGHHAIGSMAELPPDARYDWINLDNVLEHLPDPLADLRRIRERLTPEGFVYVEVPNEWLIQFKYRINDWARGFSKPPTFPGHMSLFTRRTLKAMSDSAGFTRAEIWSESISAPWRIQALAGIEPDDRLKRILAVLRRTKLDLILGQGYFLCALLRR